jgi:hypothetical protein
MSYMAMTLHFKLLGGQIWYKLFPSYSINIFHKTTPQQNTTTAASNIYTRAVLEKYNYL